MNTYQQLLRDMVEAQLIARGISAPRVLEAFRKVPRHAFVPENMRGSAYEDCALPIGEGQTISQPYMVAIMTELLKLKGGEKVLEIGTGSGYQTALLAELCQKVYTMERIKALAQRAENILRGLGYNNVEYIVGDGTEGYPPQAPYDGILVTAGCPAIPPPLIDQLTEGGRLVVPVGERHLQTLIIATKEKGEIKVEESIGCVFVPLIGKFGLE